jgi:hypothetical protein
VHVHLKVSHREWLDWAGNNDIHPLVLEYIGLRPDHLWSQPPKHEEPFSTPRSWHMLSDALHSFGDELNDEWLAALAYGCLSPHHASQFKAYVRQARNRYQLSAILKGDANWPSHPDERDILYFLAQSFRAQLLKELPRDADKRNEATRQLAFRAKAVLKDLASISLEIAQLVVAEENNERLPAWFMVELVRDLPRLAQKK